MMRRCEGCNHYKSIQRGARYIYLVTCSCRWPQGAGDERASSAKRRAASWPITPRVLNSSMRLLLVFCVCLCVALSPSLISPWQLFQTQICHTDKRKKERKNSNAIQSGQLRCFLSQAINSFFLIVETHLHTLQQVKLHFALAALSADVQCAAEANSQNLMIYY